MLKMFSQRSFRMMISICACVFILTRCIDSEKDKPVAGKTAVAAFAGSAKCSGCHSSIYANHVQTAHYLSSQLPDEKNIKGSFKEDSNKFHYNPSLFMAMEKRDSGLYQVAYFHGKEKIALPFDMVIGSGAKGQTYIHRQGNRLFQLPVSYLTAANQWANSPGFPDAVQYDRPITSRCLECHTTHADIISTPDSKIEEFSHQNILYGIDCEKCHGPAANHVEFHTQNPAEVKGKFIVDPGSFSRQQTLDLCSSCHGGKMTKLKPSFEFSPGDKLSEFFIPDSLDMSAVNYGIVDVHGNQFGLLKASKCFTMSNTMTCASCHNPHENERGKIEVFSQRCMSCHSPAHENFCKMQNSLGSAITTNCIDCHMPKQRSMAIAMKLSGEEVPKAALIRTHFISIYPEETRHFAPGKKQNKLK